MDNNNMLRFILYDTLLDCLNMSTLILEHNEDELITFKGFIHICTYEYIQMYEFLFYDLSVLYSNRCLLIFLTINIRRHWYVAELKY